MKTLIRIATRKSALAIWQTEFVKHQLQLFHPHIEVEIHGILTTADKMLIPLNKIGGKGLFVKELEKALLDNAADLAVHSIKDMPGELPEGLFLAIACKREDPRDAFISNKYVSLNDLPEGAIVGTSSLRRKAQVLRLRPDLKIKPLRGNVLTRLEKLDANEFDAIILAAIGLKRLNLDSRIRSYFSIEEILPAAGQGAIGIECRRQDYGLTSLLSPLNDPDTCCAILAERAVTNKLGGSCQIPIAAHAIIEGGEIIIRAMVADTLGTTLLRSEQRGPKDQAENLGLAAALDLISQGAMPLLESVLEQGKTDAPE